MTFPLLLIDTPEFANARCADRSEVPDPDIFNPDADDPHRAMKEQEAKKICEGCAEKVQCMLYALEKKESGIWGGTSERQRRRMRRNGYRTGSAYTGTGRP